MPAGERPETGRLLRAGMAWDYTPGVSAQTAGPAGLRRGPLVIRPADVPGLTCMSIASRRSSSCAGGRTVETGDELGETAVARPGDLL